MVRLGIVAAHVAPTSTIGKIACAYMPIFIFFAQGFEHSVVNMFVIPTGMMMGAKITFSEWWLWNQIPVTLGNLVGGFVFTGLALYITHKPRSWRRRRSSRRRKSRPNDGGDLLQPRNRPTISAPNKNATLRVLAGLQIAKAAKGVAGARRRSPARRRRRARARWPGRRGDCRAESRARLGAKTFRSGKIQARATSVRHL